MYPYLGDFDTGKTIFIPWHTFDANGASVTQSGLAVGDIQVYRGTSMTQRASTNGYALVDTDGIDIDSITGFHGISIDTSDNSDAGFWAAGNDYTVVISSVTVNSQTVNFIAARFSIRNRYAVPPVEQTVPQFGPRMLSGTTDQYIYFTARSATDHSTRLTGLSAFTVYRSRNGGTATVYTTPTISEISAANMPGIYRLLLDEDMTIDAGDYSQEIALYITCATMDPVERRIELYRRDVDAPVRGVALSDIPVYLVSNVDHVTPATGQTVTVQVQKDGGAFAAAAGTVTEVAYGVYQFDASAADMTADVVVFRFTASGADPFLVTIKTVS